jgi:hypothetical protein
MKHLVFILLLLASAAASAIVIRDDVPDSRYVVPESSLAALVDLAHEGHGVLIAPQWVVTAAHATQWHPVTEVMLEGECLKVEQVFVHPGYRRLPDALAAGDAKPAMELLAGSDDIALIKLAKPVAGIEPVALYRARDELGHKVVLYGKGATGNGRTGQGEGPNRTVLRRAENVISAVEDRWLVYTFDAGRAALPLEGTLGNGDSGGPVLLRHHGRWELAGLASWKVAQGKLSEFRPGLYGQRSYQVRISHYVPWIEATMKAPARSAR